MVDEVLPEAGQVLIQRRPIRPIPIQARHPVEVPHTLGSDASSDARSEADNESQNRFTSAGLVGSDEKPSRANNCSLVNIPGRADPRTD